MPHGQDPALLVGPLHPQPGAPAVHPGPRLHPGDPRSGAGRAARRDPRRLRHLAEREARRSCAARSSSSCWPGSSPARCAGSRPRTCCSSRRPPAVSGVERFVEIGVKSAPTVAGLATNTLKLPEYSHSTVEVLNSERDAAVLFATDTDPEPEPEADEAPAARSATEAVLRSRRGRTGCRPRGAVGRPRPDDLTFDAADATVALIALSAKMRHRPDRGAGLHRDHHRRCVLATQPAAGRPGFRAEPGCHRRCRRRRSGRAEGSGQQAGAHLQAVRPGALRCDQRSAAHDPRPVRQAAGLHRRAGRQGVGTRRRLDQARHRRGGAGYPRGLQRPRRRPRWAARRCAGRYRPPSTRRSTPRLPRSAPARASRCSLPSAGGGARRCRGFRGARRVRREGDRPRRRAGHRPRAWCWVSSDSTTRSPRPSRPPTPSWSTWSPPNSVRTGRDWWRRRSTPARPSCSTTAGPVPVRTWRRLWLTDEDEIDADWARLSERFEGAGHVVATQANWWQGKALAAGRNVHASLYGRIAAGAENPGKGRYTDEIAVVTGASKGSIAASVVAQLLEGGAHGDRHHVQARRRPAGVLQGALPRQRPLRRDAVGGSGQHGVLLRHRRAGRVGGRRADGEPWAARPSTSRMR